MPFETAPPTDFVIGRPPDAGSIALATHYRGTWVTTSIASLRERQLFDAYIELLPAALRDAVLFVPAMSWASSAIVEAHYEACDRLRLSAESAVEMGVMGTHRLKTGAVVLGYSLAAQTGFSPWTLLERLDKVWARAANGGAVAVARTGPKEARIELYGFPLVRIPYVRHAIRGVVRGALDPFVKQCVVAESSGRRIPHSIFLKTQWV